MTPTPHASLINHANSPIQHKHIDLNSNIVHGIEGNFVNLLHNMTTCVGINKHGACTWTKIKVGKIREFTKNVITKQCVLC